MSEIGLENLGKSFGRVRAVDGVSLRIGQGELLTLLGPSGCGKTTLLRMIAGFVEPDNGRIKFDGEVMNNVPAEKRRFGMVFQSYALFPHMSVEGNVSFGLRTAGIPRDAARARVAEALALVRLEGYETRRPSQLSGGQKQRVALARAIALSPRILLLDEPLSALDAKIRLFLRSEIRAIQKRTQITTVYVTHDQEEALAISDRIAVMKDGTIQQVGSPSEIYDTPANSFVAGFIGISNMFEGELGGGKCRLSGGMEFLLGGAGPPGRPGRVKACVRPESIRVMNGAGTAAREPNTFTGRLRSMEYLGSVKRLVVECANGLLLTIDHNGNGADPGRKELLFHIPPDKIRVLEA